MTRDEKDAILGRTRREYREAKSNFGALKKRHAELVSELKAFLLALESEPLHVHASRRLSGALQDAVEFQDADYFYSHRLADKLAVDALGNLPEPCH